MSAPPLLEPALLAPAGEQRRVGPLPDSYADAGLIRVAGDTAAHDAAADTAAADDAAADTAAAGDAAADDGAGPDLSHHGDTDAVGAVLDLAVNVRPGGPPRWLADALRAAVADLGRYPDPRRAQRAIAARHGCDPSEVLLTAGAAEAFTLLARSSRAPVVAVHPSFTEPERAARAAGRPVHRLLLRPETGFTVDADALAALPGWASTGADLVVGNPTNPTGVVHDAAALAAAWGAGGTTGRRLVVDEAFADTLPAEAVHSLADRRPRGVVVVRSLTKTWGLAGLRVGYLLADPSTVRQLAALQPPWAVSALALVAAELTAGPAALAQARERAATLHVERARLRAALAALPGWTPQGPQPGEPAAGAFLLVAHPQAAAVRRRLAADGIALRRGDTFPGLGADYLRVAVREPAAPNPPGPSGPSGASGPPGPSGALSDPGAAGQPTRDLPHPPIEESL